MKAIESITIEDVEDTFDLNALVQALIKLPNLKEVSLKSYSSMNQRLTQESVTQLLTSPTIESLILRQLRLGPILPELLVSCLENNQVLTKLSLERNSLDRDSGMALSYVISSNTTLQSLDLGYNNLPDEVGSAIFAALASNNHSLRSIDLTGNDLELYTCRRIAHLLANNDSSLGHLTLNQNPLCDEGVSMIAAGLEHNTTLQSLSLAETKITDASCSVMAASLRVNSTLERLNVADNKINDAGCICLCRTLQENSTLVSLNLQCNGLRNESALHLAEMLKHNETLERLNLSNNPLLVDYRALERTLIDDNYTLRHLWLPSALDVVRTDCTIPSFIRLNKLGRKDLLDNLDDTTRWLNTLNETSSDIHCLYFLIRSNPAVVSWMQK
jgi:Ran GTPase-activating protein (RanGAP) involved in mRNA processing and transport